MFRFRWFDDANEPTEYRKHTPQSLFALRGDNHNTNSSLLQESTNIFAEQLQSNATEIAALRQQVKKLQLQVQEAERENKKPKKSGSVVKKLEDKVVVQKNKIRNYQYKCSKLKAKVKKYKEQANHITPIATPKCPLISKSKQPKPTHNHNHHIHDCDEEKKTNNNTTPTLAYYDILNKNNEILQYDPVHHPKPKYFPYDHDEKLDELDQEGPEAWAQFDDEDEPDEDDEDVKKVRTYREYKKRRMLCKQQITAINRAKKHKIKSNEILIAIAGDGSKGGQLGVGNGSVTRIRNNISPFPFIMSSLLPKKSDIIMTATGIMSTAVVTADNELYVWGLNDKSELTINPKNINEVDVGDDDDQLSPSIAWERLYAYYYEKITQIYRVKNPSKLVEKKGDVSVFVDRLLVKRKSGKLIISCGNKSEIKNGAALWNECVIKKIVQRFRDKCKRKRGKQVIYREEVNIEATALEIHTMYIKICNFFRIGSGERVLFFIPKATEQEVRDRRDRKLNPYKYLKQEDMDDDDDGDTKVKLIAQDSENKPSLTRLDVKMDDNESDSEYEYEQKDTHEEDNFQATCGCSYWTPANITLPYKMVIKSVSLGGAHMVVLDNIGQVWSSGTFMNDGVIGHHFDSDRNKIIRFQRTLHRISDIESQDDGLSLTRSMTKNKKLPVIDKIASGVNHFLMLDHRGSIWTMGVKLGQRWCARNIKKYLCPQRISVINHNNCRRDKRASRRIKFRDIACGNHHNVAISNGEDELYSWGQNIWLQCGHSTQECGYGNVVDQPRWVPFYNAKININDGDEKDIVMAYNMYPHIRQVVAGEHMTIALDIHGRVWTCGRNACGALGRKTRCEGNRDYGIHGVVKTEVEPDIMRCVDDLAGVFIDWIGCGSVFWFAHDKNSGHVYTFGDSSSGRAGIGQWKYSRGRTVFDEYNMDLGRYEVTSANGGSDHCVFTIKRKAPAVSRRRSCVGSNTNSRESSLSLDESVMNGFSNLQTSETQVSLNQNNKNKNKNVKAMSATQKPKRKSRKRRFNEIGGIPEENESMENNSNVRFDNEPPVKRAKKMLKFSATTPVASQNKNKKS